ncbi:TIGR02281 family clan AA aspartic protease [Novosphingobium sp. ZN18A2]|uniref:retropepsin-like aspartic protease family protein n=1 Tax=Novosphingobium sp. ZN18A2 TaxID=3079861 RepID=UPI0030D17F57
MVRLLSIAFGMIGIMLLAAQFLGGAHPLSPAADAPAVTGRNPWSNHASEAAAKNAPTVYTGVNEASTIARGPDGQFHLNATIDGQDTRFLVDTGADVVALTVDEARRLGIFVDPPSFQPILRTASGTGYGQAIQIDRLEIAGRELDDVDAVVVQGLSTNLLGQSVLRRLGRVELSGDRLVIEPA